MSEMSSCKKIPVPPFDFYGWLIKNNFKILNFVSNMHPAELGHVLFWYEKKMLRFEEMNGRSKCEIFCSIL